MKRILSFVLGAALIAVLVVPVSAAGNENGWIELLESVTIQPNGENWWTMNGSSGTLTIPLPMEKRLRKIDMLLWNPSGQRPTGATVTAGGRTLNLSIYGIGGNLTRITGYLPDTWYESIDVVLSKDSSSSMSYEVLSCKVTPIGIQEFTAAGNVFLDNTYYPFSQIINSKLYSGGTQYGQIAILVTDWQKYDRLSIWGSAEGMIFTSFRPSIGTSGLAYELSYLASTSPGQWVEVESSESGYYLPGEYQDEYEGSGFTEGFTDIRTDGKYLFCITIDLTSCDRTLTDSLVLYITGLFEGDVGYSFNCQYVNAIVPGTIFLSLLPDPWHHSLENPTSQIERWW